VLDASQLRLGKEVLQPQPPHVLVERHSPTKEDALLAYEYKTATMLVIY
jgi:hypothetical protein